MRLEKMLVLPFSREDALFFQNAEGFAHISVRPRKGGGEVGDFPPTLRAVALCGVPFDCGEVPRHITRPDEEEFIADLIAFFIGDVFTASQHEVIGIDLVCLIVEALYIGGKALARPQRDKFIVCVAIWVFVFVKAKRLPIFRVFDAETFPACPRIGAKHREKRASRDEVVKSFVGHHTGGVFWRAGEALQVLPHLATMEPQVIVAIHHLKFHLGTFDALHVAVRGGESEFCRDTGCA